MSSAPDPFFLLLAAVLSLPIVIAVYLRAPAIVTLGFIAVLYVFSSSTWGQLQEENTIYARGTGLFAFSLLNLLLWTAAAAMLIRTRMHLPHQGKNLSSPFPVFLAVFSFMLLGHLALGLMSGEEPLTILGYNGIINVLNMALFSLLILSVIDSEQRRRQLLLLLLGLAAARAAFGLVRYQFFGGDSANPYRNFEKLDIKLVYFDIADNYVAALAAFCIAWLLMMPGVRMSLHKRALLLGLFTIEVATVALSFRRSSLVGLGLMFAVLLWQLPWQRRILCGGIGLTALVIGAATLMRERLQFNTQRTGFLSSLLYDVGPARATEVSRFYELEAAAKSLDGQWLFGLGSWGTFYGNEDALDYHFGKFDFVHSGFGHLILKSGLVGLMVFLSLLAACVLHYFRHRPAIRGNGALLADMGMAGVLFWLPTLFIGTPIIEFRSMLLIGMTLALVYLHPRLIRSRTHYLAQPYVGA
ncbi:MFS_SLCO5_OATP5 domain containing protein [Oxalobacteraceae bacterium]